MGSSVRSSAYQEGLRRRRPSALERLTENFVELRRPPGRGRKRYHHREVLERTVAERIAQAWLTGWCRPLWPQSPCPMAPRAGE